jgi:hypothetical protein
MRYSYTDIKKTFDGKDSYRSTFYPVIHDDETDIYIIAADNVFLDKLSKQYYGSERYWWVIALANNINTCRLSIPVGKQIKIPGNLDRIIEDLRNIN